MTMKWNPTTPVPGEERPYPIELTSKRWKAWILFGLALTLLGAFFGYLYTEEVERARSIVRPGYPQTAPSPAMKWLAGLFGIPGVLVVIVAKLRAWWERG